MSDGQAAERVPEVGARAPEPALLEARGDAPAPLVFHRGTRWPFAVRWFGIMSLFGNLRSFVASAIASEQIDSRDWMRPQAADELKRAMVRILGGDETRATLSEALDRPLWIDFVADTGDDRDVSEAVGRMLFAEYRVKDGAGERVLPRGEVLLFGGDTAYPVATADEIYRRVTQPWNQVLREAPADAKRRVLLGIPGNHDWYDGVDGFARLFRRRIDAEDGETPDSVAPADHTEDRKTVGFVARQLHLDEVEDSIGLIANMLRSIKALVKGTKIKRRKRLSLDGYEAVQEATYFALPLAPGLDVYAVDRQLGRLDYRQRAYFQMRREHHPDARIMFVAPDPALAYGDPWDPGQGMLKACALRLEQDRLFYMTGDVHHYERRVVGDSVHMIAGGGGAFLCGTRIPPSPAGPSAAAFPTGPESRRLVWQVPLRMMVGAGGLLPHWGFALVAFLELAASLRGTITMIVVATVLSLVLAFACYVNAGHHGQRAQPKKVLAISLLYGIGFGAMPMALKLLLPNIHAELAEDGAIIAIYAFLGALGFGLFSATLALTGLHSQQAYVALMHPGFKHFVRLCVHPDGRVEAFTIGKEDPLGPGEPKLVDRFEWSPSPSGRTANGA